MGTPLDLLAVISAALLILRVPRARVEGHGE